MSKNPNKQPDRHGTDALTIPIPASLVRKLLRDYGYTQPTPTVYKMAEAFDSLMERMIRKHGANLPEAYKKVFQARINDIKEAMSKGGSTDA